MHLRVQLKIMTHPHSWVQDWIDYFTGMCLDVKLDIIFYAYQRRALVGNVYTFQASIINCDH